MCGDDMTRKERKSTGVTSLDKERILPDELLNNQPGSIHIIDGKHFLHLTDEEVKSLKEASHQQ